MFRELIATCGDLSLEQVSALERHYELMCRWNKVLNLTTIHDLEQAVQRHYCEALFLASHLPSEVSVADIGSGAGFPGFVVAVVRPGCEVTLIEAHKRKAVFLQEASRGMPNVRVVAVRAESVKARFDWTVSRAVSYDDLGKALLALAPRTALLTGIEDPPLSWGLSWRSFPLPGADQRFLRIGES